MMIDVEHVQLAIEFCAYLESHLSRIYSLAPENWQLAVTELEKHLMRGDLGEEFTVREIVQREWSFLEERRGTTLSGHRPS